MTNAATNDNNVFHLRKTELYIPIVTLSTNDNVKLTSSLSKVFKGSIFWNKYKSKIETHTTDANNLKRIVLDSSFQGVNRLSVLAYDGETANKIININSDKQYAWSRVNVTKFNVLIDGRNFYDQPISDEIKKYNELIQLTTGKSEDYTTGCLLDLSYFKKHYNIIASDLSKQKELDADPRSIQQIEIVFMLDTASRNLTILEKSKETVLQLYKGATKVL